MFTAGGCEQEDKGTDDVTANVAGAGEGGDAGHTGAVGSAGEGGMNGGGIGGARPDDSCEQGPFTIDSCQDQSFHEHSSCPPTVQEALDVACARRPSPWEVSRSRTECGQTMIVVEYGWGTELFYFDAAGQPVGYAYGTDSVGDCATYGASCAEELQQRVLVCGDDTTTDGAAGAGGQGGAGGQANAAEGPP